MPPNVRMPGARSRDAPVFLGRKVEQFIEEYEALANAAGLDDSQKCVTITKYCQRKDEQFIESLPEYAGKDWKKLKETLLDVYKQEDEEVAYRIVDLETFSAKERHIDSPMKLARYYRNFLIISNYLLKKKLIVERGRDDLFYRGVKPKNLRTEIGEQLKRTAKWTDMTAPPSMMEVKKKAEELLKEDRYEFSYELDYGEPSSEVVEDDEDDYAVPRHPAIDDLDDYYDRSATLRPTIELKAVRTDLKPSRTEQKSAKPEPKPEVKSSTDTAMEELTKRLEKFTIVAERLITGQGSAQNREERRPSTSFGPRLMRCYMCGEEVNHRMKDCPETIAFRTSNVVKITSDDRVVRADGTRLPRGSDKVGEGGIAKVLREELNRKASSASTVELLRECFNGDGDWIGMSEHVSYEVMPATHDKINDNRTHPYQRKEWPSVIETRTQKKKREEAEKNAPTLKPTRALKSPPRNPTPKPSQSLPKGPPPPGIIIMPTTPIDMPMTDGTRDRPRSSSPAPQRPRTPPPSARAPQPEEPARVEKPKNVDIEILPNPPKPSLPRKKYRFASEIQDSVDHDELLDKMLDQEVTVTMRDLLSTFELSKRMQALTKSQRIATSSSKEVKFAEVAIVEAAQNASYAFDEKVELVNEVEGDWQGEIWNFERDEYSDEEESEGTDIDAESYYDKLREIEWLMENGYDIHRDAGLVMGSNRFLAMVTAKLHGEVNGHRVTMLVDTGSELNLISTHLQETLELPVDPSGADWTLKGVNGPPVGLLGLCRNVPIDIGGLKFNHNFFITSSPMGSKDMILGQPWLWHHAALIDFAPGVGMIIRVWENGDRQQDKSINMTVHLLDSPRNVMRISAGRKHASVDHMEVVMPQEQMGREDRASGNTDLPVASFPSSIQKAFDVPEGDSQKFGPLGRDVDFVSKYVRLPAQVAEALARAWHSSGLAENGRMANHVRRIAIRKGYEDYEATAFSTVFEREVLGGKYKPVAKKVQPINAYDPDSYVPEYRPVIIGELPPLPTSPPSRSNAKYTERLSRERIDTIVSNMAANFLSDEETALLIWVLLQHEKAIAFTDVERGTFNPDYFPDYVMRTVPHEPWQVKPIRLPRAKEEMVMKLLQEQKDGGKYELSSASYRSAFFAVEKKGGMLRIVHDLQPLNAVTIRDAGLPPRIDEIIEKLKGHAIYCIADLKAGYDAVRLAKESRDLTSFHAYGYGLMRLTVLPQGYTNSMQEFCRRTNHMIHAMIPREALVFVDDVTAFGPKTRYNDESIPQNPAIRKFVWEFAQTLQRLLAHLELAGVTVSGSKLVLATPMLDVLGTTVSLEGAHVAKSAIGRILKWPACESPTEVRQFLGTIGVMRRWIMGFSVIAKPLTLLTMKTSEKEFEWSQEAAESMQELKDALERAPPLAALDYDLASKIVQKEYRTITLGLVTIAVDSSWRGAGWVITQELEHGEVPILFGSVTFKPHESRYSQPKLELYGLFRALKAERHLLHGIHFRIKLDARSVVEMINRPDLPNAPLNRWIAYIQQYDFEILYNPATKHKAADGLSRRRRSEDDSDDDTGSYDSDEDHLFLAVPKDIPRVNVVEAEPPVSLPLSAQADPLELQAASELLEARLDRRVGECLALEVRWNVAYGISQVKGNLYAGMTEQPNEVEGEDEAEEPLVHEHKRRDHDSEEYWQGILAFLVKLELPKEKALAQKIKMRSKNFFIHEGILWRRNKAKAPQQVVLDPGRRARLIREAHDESGHRGKDPTYIKLRDSFWFPNMYEQIVQYCRTCHECQMRSARRDRVPIQIPYVQTILRTFSIDAVHMPEGKYGLHYVVDMREHLSGFLEYKAVRNLTSRAVADFIFEVMCRYGCFPKLITDGGSEFKGAVIELANRYNVPLIPISAYNPQANGVVERGHGVYIDSIWKVLQGHTSEWPDIIGYAVWADRITAKRTTGASPAFLLYGQQPLLPFDLTDRSWHVLPWPGVETTEDLLALRIKQISRRDKFLGEVSARIQKAQQKSAEYFERRHIHTMTTGIYEVGTLVLVWNNRFDGKHDKKGQLRWLGPYVVVQRRPTGAYVLSELDGTVFRSPVAARRIKLYQHRGNIDPIIRVSWQTRFRDWNGEIDDGPEDETNEEVLPELETSRVVAVRRRRSPEGPKLPRPWELKGEEATRYWMQIEDDVRSGEQRRRLESKEEPEWQVEIDRWNKEQAQWENYHDDYRGMSLEEIPRYLTDPFKGVFRPVLFKWKDESGWLRGAPVYETATAEVNGPKSGNGWIRTGKQTITVEPARTPFSGSTQKFRPAEPKRSAPRPRGARRRNRKRPHAPQEQDGAAVVSHRPYSSLNNDLTTRRLPSPRDPALFRPTAPARPSVMSNYHGLRSAPHGLVDVNEYMKSQQLLLGAVQPVVFPYPSIWYLVVDEIRARQYELQRVYISPARDAVLIYRGGSLLFDDRHHTIQATTDLSPTLRARYDAALRNNWLMLAETEIGPSWRPHGPSKTTPPEFTIDREAREHIVDGFSEILRHLHDPSLDPRSINPSSFRVTDKLPFLHEQPHDSGSRIDFGDRALPLIDPLDSSRTPGSVLRDVMRYVGKSTRGARQIIREAIECAEVQRARARALVVDVERGSEELQKSMNQFLGEKQAISRATVEELGGVVDNFLSTAMRFSRDGALLAAKVRDASRSHEWNVDRSLQDFGDAMKAVESSEHDGTIGDFLSFYLRLNLEVQSGLRRQFRADDPRMRDILYGQALIVQALDACDVQYPALGGAYAKLFFRCIKRMDRHMSDHVRVEDEESDEEMSRRSESGDESDGAGPGPSTMAMRAAEAIGPVHGRLEYGDLDADHLETISDGSEKIEDWRFAGGSDDGNDGNAPAYDHRDPEWHYVE